MTVSSTVLAAAEELLGMEAQPLVNDFIGAIQAAGKALVGKLPAGAQGEVGAGVTLLTTLASIAAQAELGTIFNHNPAVAAGAAAAAAALNPPAPPAPTPSATAVPVTPAAPAPAEAPAEGASSPGVVPFPGAGPNEPA